MKTFCKSLREHEMKTANFKNKKKSYLQNNSRNHMKMQKFTNTNLEINI